MFQSSERKREITISFKIFAKISKKGVKRVNRIIAQKTVANLEYYGGVEW